MRNVLFVASTAGVVAAALVPNVGCGFARTRVPAPSFPIVPWTASGEAIVIVCPESARNRPTHLTNTPRVGSSSVSDVQPSESSKRLMFLIVSAFGFTAASGPPRLRLSEICRCM